LLKPAHQATLAFTATALVTFALRSRDCFFVDGAPRCLTVYTHPTLLFHPNNHLLYLVNVLLWTRSVGALGFNLGDPLRFFLAVDTMNGLAAAGSIAILYWIILRVTSSWKLTTTVCLAYGLTTAFLAQATNPNEPMVGAFWSFLAIALALLSLGDNRLWPLALSGLVFTLAMATYRSMVLIAPAAAVTIVSFASAKKSTPVNLALRLATLGTAFAAGCVLIFGWAYSLIGVPRAAMLAKFLHQEDAEAYLDLSLNQWLKLPLGLVRNCFPVVPFFNGMRGFLTGPRSVFLPVTFLIVALWLGLFFCGYTVLRRWAALNPQERTAVLASLTGVVFTLIPLLTWSPLYGKFWIQPLACLAVLVAVAFGQFSQASRQLWVACRIAGLLFLLGVAFNLPWAFRNHWHQPFEFEEASKVKQFVGEKDFVVLDRGADSVSVMYAYLWAHDNQFLPVMDIATVRRTGLISDVDAAVRNTQAHGGKVFFLGVVDLSKPVWDNFLGKHCGVPYESFDHYRSAVYLKAQFESRTGPTFLWELDSPSPPR